MPKSEDKNDFWGNSYIEHCDDLGNKVGETREKIDIWGEKYTEHVENDGGHVSKLHNPERGFEVEASARFTGTSKIFDKGPEAILGALVLGIIIVGGIILYSASLVQGPATTASQISPARPSTGVPNNTWTAPKAPVPTYSSGGIASTSNTPVNQAHSSAEVLSRNVSPRHHFYIEDRPGGQIWLVNVENSSRQKLLYTHYNSANVVVSPDERWLVVNDLTASFAGGARLFVRQSSLPDNLLDYVSTNHTNEELEQTVWRYYLRMTDRPPGSDRDHVAVSCIGWDQASLNLTLRLLCSGLNTDNSVPVPWFCRYNVLSKEITSLSPLRNFSIIKDGPVAFDPSPHSFGDLDLFKFVWQHVENENSHGYDDLADTYTEWLDYWGDRVAWEHVLKDKTAYFVRWPRSREDITSGVDIHPLQGGQIWSATYTTRFRTESDERNEFVEGRQVSTLEIARIGGKFKIRAENGKVLFKEKGNLNPAIAKSAPPGGQTKHAPPPPASAAPQVQLWTDITGASVYGVMDHMANGEVFIRRAADNNGFRLPFSKLTPECQRQALRNK